MKRINIKLVAILTALFVGICVGGTGLYHFQMSRNTQTFLAQAEEYKAQGDLDNARKSLRRYLQYKPDDGERLVDLALWTKEWFDDLVISGSSIEPRDFQQTYALIEAGLRENPRSIALRDAAIQFATMTGRMPDAISHIRSRLELDGGDRGKLLLQLATCHARTGDDKQCLSILSELIGLDFDKAAAGAPPFDATTATMPDEINAYLLMSDILISRSRQPEMADKVITQMVEANPDSAMAHVGRARYLRIQKGISRIDEAEHSIDRAMSLSLTDDEAMNPILKEAADVYMIAGKYQKARMQLSRYLERNPDAPDSYRMLSTWALRQNKLVQAREFINQGLERNSNDRSLLEALVTMELDGGSQEGAETSIESLRQIGLNSAILSFYEARLDLLKQNTVKAARTFEEIAPEIAQIRPNWTPKIDRALAMAYSELGQNDRALRRYMNLIEASPNDLRALWGMILAYRGLGQVNDSIDSYVKLNTAVASEGKLPVGYPFLIQHLEMELIRQKQRSESQRSWEFAETIVRDIQASKMNEGQKYTILANYFEQIGDAVRADRVRDYINEKDPNNVALQMSDIAKLANTDIEAAIAKLDRFDKTSGGKMIATKLMRIELLGKQMPADFREQLVAIEGEAGDFTPQQQVILYKTLGAGYMAIQETSEVERLYRRAIENAPQDVDMRMQVLKLGIHRGDEESIKSAILEIANAFGTDGPEHDFARASYLIWQQKNGLGDAGTLDEANSLVQSGLSKREGWADLRHLSAEVNKLKGDTLAAINEMEKALKTGKARVNDIRQYAQLLYSSNRLSEAKEKYDSIGRRHWTVGDELTYLEIQSRLGELPAEVKFDRESKNAFYLLNVGKILSNDAEIRSRLKGQPTEVTDIIPKRLADAADCFRKSVEQEPTLEEGWKYLIRTLVLMKKKDEATEAVRQAQLEITEERSQLFLAHVNEYMGNFGEAYTHYKSSLKTDPENVEALAGIVNLLQLGSGQPGFEGRVTEAESYVDRIINLTPDPTKAARTRIQALARRMRAKKLVESNTYHDFVAALSLLEQNRVEGQSMAPEDMLLFGMFSASRNDGVSRDRAIQKLEQVQDAGKRKLTNEELLVLAELYNKQDRWQDCSSVMNNLLSKYPNDMTLLGPWLSWLVEDGQLKLAERWLENANPQSMAAVRTRAHIWVKSGETKRALNLLLGLLPKEISSRQQESLTITLAKAMERMARDDSQIYKYVEEVWRNYARQRPEQSLMLAAYLGTRGEMGQIDEALKICKAHVDSGKLQQTLPVALGILRVNQSRIPIGSQHHKRVRTWFDAAKRVAPDSPALTIQRSEFDGLMGDFDAVEKSLRQYVSSDEITSQQKATAYNNLAYVLALRGKGEESMRLVEQAVDILGPISDLRDTRAMVYLALNKPNQALEDLNAAIDHGGESAFKLFHKALAELETGHRENATESMQKAIDLGLEINQLNILEKRQFEELVSKLNIEATKPVSTVAP